ncbi:D-serine deaminase-like pyridoxal phosphate-dependent protein [Kibdelosporangium banguiense]|uniref:D-serine deaminase-like pyridoxal phosphate-dependent protein n=1 Tax=Kibdelosporangium banguiense TaxID=1365924 RepID=A0ABS4TCV6_9PSEU|nr:amino acid deaminase/aldolase [Kibdelosporangium banguiense]MBP2321804.1 D-serine deaminase-like pyridoxal phosphate-dependent protein [Kibdelosporangium banguiense]
MTQQANLDTATKGLDPPFAVVDLDAFDANAADLVRRAGGRPIRVASKSVRCLHLIERVLGMPGFQGVMAYSLREALWLAGKWRDTPLAQTDILVAYPTTDHAALRELAADPAAAQVISIMADSVQHLDLIDAALGIDHPAIRVCLEFDAAWRPLPGIYVGTRRSPVRTPRQAARLAAETTRRPGFSLVGVMSYEGQIAGLGDAPPGNPLKGGLIAWMQRRSGPELIKRRSSAIAAIRAITDLEFVNGGGTGSLELTSADPSVTELAAGSGLIGPWLFDSYRGFTPRPAALFALPVVRRPAPNIATLFAGGYVASGTGTPNRLPRPYLPEGLKLLGTEGAGEVQTPVVGKAADSLKLGDRVWLRHSKAGELAERFQEYHLIRGDRTERTVPTYRGEGVNFG